MPKQDLLHFISLEFNICVKEKNSYRFDENTQPSAQQQQNNEQTNKQEQTF